MGFKPVLRALGSDIVIYVSRDSFLSLMNSPYPAHILSSAVDIYCGEAYMPCEYGVVCRVIRFDPPRNRVDAEPYDYALIIRVGDYCLKILHVEPSVKVGDTVRLGDELGRLITSGYLMPWSGRHMHVEVRRVNDPLRALGALELKPTEELMSELRRLRYCSELKLRVISNKGTHYLAEPVNCDAVGVKVGESIAALDAGAPHYGVGGAVIISKEWKALAGKEVRINNQSIGKVIKECRRRSALIISFNKAFDTGSGRVGIGAYLMSKQVKIIPLSRKVRLRINDTIKLGVRKADVKLPKWIRRLQHRRINNSTRPS